MQGMKKKLPIQRTAEGARLKLLYLQRVKAAGITQEAFCDAMGLNLGMLQQMFTGKTPIPLETLLDLALAIGFDPREVRPELQRTLDKMLVAIQPKDSAELRKTLKSLTPESRKAVDRLLSQFELD